MKTIGTANANGEPWGICNDELVASPNANGPVIAYIKDRIEYLQENNRIEFNVHSSNSNR